MKHFWDKLILLTLALMLFAIPVRAEPQQTLYLQQAAGNTCTLCASTMMLRSCLYRAGSDDWQEVTESDVRRWAWTGEGLLWNWDYAIGSHSFTVSHESLSGISKTALQALLEEHPEGLVLYCGGGAPHAVFLTDCAGGVFYCADSADTYAGRRIPLSESLLGHRYGDQEAILEAVTACWYIAESNVQSGIQKFILTSLRQTGSIIWKKPMFFSENH